MSDSYDDDFGLDDDKLLFGNDDLSDKGSGSGSDSIKEYSGAVGLSIDKEKDEKDTKRNEVRKEFTLEFEKKIAKYIPPKIQFKGNLLKKKNY